MSKTNLIGSCEITINRALKRISMLEGKDKKALESEYREWIDAIKSVEDNYDILYVDKID